MTDYSELVKALRYCTDNEPSNGDCWNCPYQGEKCHTLLSDAAAAIEELQATIELMQPYMPDFFPDANKVMLPKMEVQE